MSRSQVAAGLLTVAAAGVVGLLARDVIGPATVPTTDEVCAAAADVLDALGESVKDQVVLRTRAAHLADLLIGQSGQEAGDTSLASARRVIGVLDDPEATVSDLSRVVSQVADQCPALRPSP